VKFPHRLGPAERVSLKVSFRSSFSCASPFFSFTSFFSARPSPLVLAHRKLEQGVLRRLIGSWSLGLPPELGAVSASSRREVFWVATATLSPFLVEAIYDPPLVLSSLKIAPTFLPRPEQASIGFPLLLHATIAGITDPRPRPSLLPLRCPVGFSFDSQSRTSVWSLIPFLTFFSMSPCFLFRARFPLTFPHRTSPAICASLDSFFPLHCAQATFDELRLYLLCFFIGLVLIVMLVKFLFFFCLS